MRKKILTEKKLIAGVCITGESYDFAISAIGCGVSAKIAKCQECSAASILGWITPYHDSKVPQVNKVYLDLEKKGEDRQKLNT